MKVTLNRWGSRYGEKNTKENFISHRYKPMTP